MKYKSIVIPFIISLTLFILGRILTFKIEFKWIEALTYIFWSTIALQVLALIYLIIRSRFYKTIYFIVSGIIILLHVFISIFEINLPFDKNYFRFLGISMIIVSYVIHFIKKQPKMILDVVKLIFVLSYLCGPMFGTLQMEYFIFGLITKFSYYLLLFLVVCTVYQDFWAGKELKRITRDSELIDDIEL